MGKEFSRGQSQVIFRHLPGSIFEHDDYGLCLVTEVAQDIVAVEVNKSALFDAMAEMMAAWREPTFIGKLPDPRDPTKQVSYSIGAPREVRFEPYPTTFECRKCHRTATYDDLVRRQAATTGNCKYCGAVGSLTRLRYIQAHNCGRIEEIFVPECSRCKSSEDIAFLDSGRVITARWVCRKCNTDVGGMRQGPCLCAYTDALGKEGARHEKSLKVVPVGDPSIYQVHTVSFINFPDETAAHIHAAADGPALVLGRVWGLIAEPVEKLLLDRAKATDAADDQAAELAEALRAVNPNHPRVKEYDVRRSRPTWLDITDRLKEGISAKGGNLSGAARRWAIEHVTLLDDTSLTDVSDVAQMLRDRGDQLGAKEIEAAAVTAREVMGIRSMRVINDFPLTLAAFGYTRLSKDPSRTVLNPYPPDERGRFPVYAVSSETEALWFELDPVAVVRWLHVNGFQVEEAKSREDAWFTLYARVPGLRDTPTEPNYNESSAVAVRTLLHTTSHVFLRRIEWSGFAPSSVGEYIIPGSLSFILYANRHAETKIGGLTTLFEQRLSTWLWDAVQAGRECIYDPICTDDGGSCAGCTHREHSCVAFNRELSRATLYGGSLPSSSELSSVRISVGYWDNAWSVTPKQ